MNLKIILSALLLIKLNSAYANQTTELDSIINSIQFYKSIPTLEKIKDIISNKKKGMYLRFGDGDINLATGEHDLYQRASQSVMSEMREALNINGQYVLKALPIHCKELNTHEAGMFPGNHEQSFKISKEILNKAKMLWGKKIDDVYSATALHFTATNNPEYCVKFLKFLKNSKCCLLVGNQNIPTHIRTLLFGDTCDFVPTPASQSYNAIDNIEQECLKKLASNNEYKIVIVAMGCSGRILQKRLWQQVDNIFLFDFGSLMDALCGWNTRAWIELTQFDTPKFLKLLAHDIKIVSTAALIENKFEIRKKEYIHSINTLAQFGYEPYIFESCNTLDNSFLNEHASNVFYTHSNNNNLRNKGVNEAASLLAGLNHYNFDDNDMIIKITGRYYFENDNFIKEVENNPDFDGFIKKDVHGEVFTGCFALKYKYFKEMLQTLDLASMEKNMINIELEVARYIDKIRMAGAKIKELPKLHLIANIFGVGNPQLTLQ